ncbi:MAG: FAD-dependent oxidoreductase [candidate division Zixibacteria bacterium]|nr:FAD-dependent oxidoreductase [candidate division Zixibacteria bacterium]MBU1471289.1 FAD-dependent oxidoreductase [candidate division Zixibacteria bacterium]MBU2625679.1 FAD-dependent oxidoreductase [candidate division Zixibacteria bacterium]
MSVNRSDFVIIGGVATGPKTAATLARRLPDVKITLFQRESLVSYATCGMPYFASGDIDSFQKLTATSYDVQRDADFFKNTKGFDVVTGAQVIRIDREKKVTAVKMLATGEVLEHAYGKLVIATGAAPMQPPFPVAESPRISSFTKPDDAVAFREAAQTGQVGKVVVVGGGFIGCEVVEAAAGLWGIETVLVEKENQILPYVLDPEMAAIAEREMMRQDVTIKTGMQVKRIDLDGDGNPVVLLQNEESISCDYVFLCLGVSPETSLARDCGLRIGDRGGIVVDSHMRTSDPDIFAGGDCVESHHLITGAQIYIPMGSLANRHGRVIAENLAGNHAEFKGVVGAFLVKIFDTNVGAVGLSQKAAEAAGFRAEAVWGAFPDKPDYYPEFGTFSVKLVYSSDDERLLGLQAVGAGDICRRIDVFSSFLQRRASVHDLLAFEHGYAPPYSEVLDPLHQMAALAIAREKGLQIVGPADKSADNVVFLDVRETEEFSSEPWPVSGSCTLVNIPLGELRLRIDELDRIREIRIVCRRGPRSYQASLILRHAGFENVTMIGGGTQASLS